MTYKDHYLNQAGSGLSVFSGARRQTGHGWFSNILRAAAPLMKRGAKAAGRHLLETGVKVMKDVESGRPLKEAVKRRITKDITRPAKVRRRPARVKRTSPRNIFE